MPQTMPPDREVGGGPSGLVNDRRDHPMSASNQPSQGESIFGDSSGPLFSVYSKAAEDEDNKMVDRWQKDADGILFFTGLFSAAVAALLAVTVQDLRPNSQDTSAFYLGNIYQILADPNVTRSSILSPVAKPPLFSPSRYAVWVNTLWFLSLVMSLSCALWATSLQKWARRYLRRAQPARCSPDKRARMRAYFAEGVDKMHIPWAVEGLPALLHLSLFLFFGGLAIFLFNVDREVFCFVISWIGLFLMVYGLITLLPIIRHESPYHSPLSTPAWFLYAGIPYLTFKILVFITGCRCWNFPTWRRCKHSRDRYQGWMLEGVEKVAEETASERSWEIYVQILDWTISAHDDGDDDSLKRFFEAIPGFFNSKLVKHLERDFPVELVKKFRDALCAFLGRTWTSNSINDSEKVRRLDISINAIIQISKIRDPFMFYHILLELQDEVPQTVEMGHTLARLCTNDDQDIRVARHIIAGIVVNVRERNDSWVMLAARLFGLPERDVRDNIAFGGDSVLLAIVIHVARQSLRPDYPTRMVLEALSKLDIRDTLPRLQHDFCTLWNELVQEARNRVPSTTPVLILNMIRHLYIALHQDTDAAPTAFILESSGFLYEGRFYPFCKIDSHHPDSTPHLSLPLPDVLSPSPTDGGNTASRQAEQLIEPSSFSNPTTTGEIEATSHSLDMIPPTNPVHSSFGASPTAVVAAVQQDITSTATLSHPLKGSEQQDSDIVAPSAEPKTSQILPTASTHAPTPTPPIPTSLPNTPSESYDAGVASVSYSSHFAPPSIRVGSSIPASRPTGSATLPRLRARGLVNTGNMYFANAVLQLLVNLPPFWNLFRELGDLKGQRGAGVPEAGGGATPLVDATVRFFKEFIVEEESPSTRQQSQPATGETSRADSFEPTYMYDAMKEKRQLKPLLDGQQQDAEEFLCLYLDALDEELPALLASNNGRQSASAALEVEEREVPQSSQAEVGSQGFVANFVESPITHIFGGKFRSPILAPNQPGLVPTEDWRSLHLDIQHDSIRTVQDTLAHISQPQSVQVSTSGLDNASEQVLIEALPPVLVLHLKRFRYDATAGCITKNGKSIQFAPELEIPLDIMVPNAQRPSEPPHYKLYGVLYHHGESAGSGHYTVDVLHPNGDGDTGEGWLHINNEAVCPMRHEDVFGEHGTERVADERCAYLLFYCRTPTET